MDFKDTDGLIRHLDRCVFFLTVSAHGYMGTYHEGVFNQGMILKERWPDLFDELVNITNGAASEENKEVKRYEAFAVTYKRPGDLEIGKQMLTHTFDEKLHVDFIERNSSLLGISEEVSKVESEFWRNFSEIKDINLLCNIYRERFKEHLCEINAEYYDWNNFLYKDMSHPLNLNFKTLRDCGLIRVTESQLECGLVNICHRVNFLSEGIVKFFTKMRRSTIDTKDLDKEPQPSVNAEPWNTNKISSNVITNYFNQMPIDEVKDFFTPLFNTMVNGNKLLADDQQLEFFNRNFLEKGNSAKKKLEFADGAHRGFVISIFHKFYLACKDKYEPSPNCSSKYKKLVTDNFLGYENFTNFRS